MRRTLFHILLLWSILPHTPKRLNPSRTNLLILQTCGRLRVLTLALRNQRVDLSRIDIRIASDYAFAVCTGFWVLALTCRIFMRDQSGLRLDGKGCVVVDGI